MYEVMIQEFKIEKNKNKSFNVLITMKSIYMKKKNAKGEGKFIVIVK
jgi:hypothetical protein